MKTVRDFLKSTSGATSIEYALVATIISLAIVGAVTTMGPKLNSRFSAVSNNLS